MQQLVEIKFDSHSKYKALLAKGFSEQQAEGIVEVFSEITLPNAATRADIIELRQDITLVRQAVEKVELTLRSEFKQDLSNLRKDLINQIYLNTFAIIGAVAAIVKLL